MADFKILRLGSKGPQTELLQLGLTRAGYATAADGIFGNNTQKSLIAFQRSHDLDADGIAGRLTWNALTPYLTGYTVYTVRRGDSLYKIASQLGTSIFALKTANPKADIYNLAVGSRLIVPFTYPIVPTNISFTSTVLELVMTGLSARYPFITVGSAGKSVMGKELYYLKIGNGARQVFYNASHHGNEWITTPLLLSFLEEYAAALSGGGTVFGISAARLYAASTLYIMPMVNPDGVDLATGELDSGRFFENAKRISADYPDIPFPSGWKANIDGIDTNLQYPAGWDNAREIKFSQGYVSPAPRDYVGTAPLEAPESRAVYDFTLQHDFALTISYHTQGEVIFWQYLDYTPENALEIARRFSRLSGYEVAQVPYESSFAGYKDWFISQYNRPGYTIEAGIGINPLPVSQFDKIRADNLGIITTALLPL
ncbi:MAG: peptidoglycan-binding protein [Oscillospiraceae bacterium]|nr:peptidoglycan-binding protein [Oscillospiraceae bacterium]